MASSQIQVASLGRSPALDALTSRIPNPFTPAKPAATAANTEATRHATAPPHRNHSRHREPQLISTGSLSGRETKRVTPNYPPKREVSQRHRHGPRVCHHRRERQDLGDQLRRPDVAAASGGGSGSRLDVPAVNHQRQTRAIRRLHRFRIQTLATELHGTPDPACRERPAANLDLKVRFSLRCRRLMSLDQ